MSGILQGRYFLGASPSGGPFAVKNSLRLRSSASAYLSRTVTLSATWTLSVWVKRGLLGVTSPIFGGSVLFNSNNTLTAGTLTTTAVYRDPSAWYHIVVSNSGCYVNGVSVGSTTTGILVNPLIGSNAINYFDGYLAELNFVDGQALTPSFFGAFDATSGVWQPTRYSGTYGTNGFYLKFSDTTSTTTLCYDYSGNSNNWTPNNISLTAGSTYDSMLDSPTNYDNGGNGVGNYAVLNPVNNSGTLSNANLTFTQASAAYVSVAGSIGISSGKWAWEIYISSGGSVCLIGICLNAGSRPIDYTAINGWVYQHNGQTYLAGSGPNAYGASYATGDTLRFELDADVGSLVVFKNNVSQGVMVSGLAAGSYSPLVILNGNGGTRSVDANFGQRPFTNSPSTGYKALNTQNLPAPSIQNGASYMAATTYTGTGASLNVSNASFQPDLVWIKSRSAATDNKLTDSVRGVTKGLISNSTAAETTDTTGLTAFGASGFTVGANTTYNNSGATYVGWQWKAGGTAVTNTAGTITSSVSANTTAGFSVVTYTGTGVANSTVGHGLNVTPGMIIVKQRNGSTYDWNSWHTSLSSGYYIQLNSTGAQDNSVAIFPANTVTSSVFNNGGTGATIYNNASGGTYVAYCFAAIAGYSAFGSYTGNGSADGPFVYCGFRPRWLLVKRTDVANSWVLMDSSRSSFNYADKILWPNLSDAEANGGTTTFIDFVSNGFKQRGAGASINASGGTYIYAAFAENPFKYSLAR